MWSNAEGTTQRAQHSIGANGVKSQQHLQRRVLIHDNNLSFCALPLQLCARDNHTTMAVVYHTRTAVYLPAQQRVCAAVVTSLAVGMISHARVLFHRMMHQGAQRSVGESGRDRRRPQMTTYDGLVGNR